MYQACPRQGDGDNDWRRCYNRGQTPSFSIATKIGNATLSKYPFHSNLVHNVAIDTHLCDPRVYHMHRVGWTAFSENVLAQCEAALLEQWDQPLHEKRIHPGEKWYAVQPQRQVSP
jgi:hypothetical protein